MPKYKRIEVRWKDHWVDNGDQTLADVLSKTKPRIGNYTGYLVYEDTEVIILCSNWWEPYDGEHDEVSDSMRIIKKDIINRSDKK